MVFPADIGIRPIARARAKTARRAVVPLARHGATVDGVGGAVHSTWHEEHIPICQQRKVSAVVRRARELNRLATGGGQCEVEVGNEELLLEGGKWIRMV